MFKMATVGLTIQWILSTIQLTHISTSNMRIGVRPAILELFDFFESKIDPDYTPKFSPIWKKVKQQPLDRI